MAQDKESNKITPVRIPNRVPGHEIPGHENWRDKNPRDKQESNNDVSNTLKPKTGTPPGKDPGKK